MKISDDRKASALARIQAFGAKRAAGATVAAPGEPRALAPVAIVGHMGTAPPSVNVRDLGRKLAAGEAVRAALGLRDALGNAVRADTPGTVLFVSSARYQVQWEDGALGWYDGDSLKVEAAVAARRHAPRRASPGGGAPEAGLFAPPPASAGPPSSAPASGTPASSRSAVVRRLVEENAEKSPLGAAIVGFVVEEAAYVALEPSEVHDALRDLAAQRRVQLLPRAARLVARSDLAIKEPDGTVLAYARSLVRARRREAVTGYRVVWTVVVDRPEVRSSSREHAPAGTLDYREMLVPTRASAEAFLRHLLAGEADSVSEYIAEAGLSAVTEDKAFAGWIEVPKARARRRASPPNSRPERLHAHDVRPIFCPFCRQRRPRAPGADMDICAPCLHDQRVKAGLVAPRAAPELDEETRSFREHLALKPPPELADRPLAPEHEEEIRRLEAGRGDARTLRAEARSLATGIEREARKLGTKLAHALKRDALAKQATHEALTRPLAGASAAEHVREAGVARADAALHLNNLRGFLTDVRDDLRRARLLDEATEIVAWNNASAARRRAMIAERSAAPAEPDTDMALLAKAEGVVDGAAERMARAPTAEERRGAEAEVERETGRPVTPPPPKPPRVEERPPRAARPALTWVWVVVPHRTELGIDSGQGFVAVEGRVLDDGTVGLLSPYDGAPIHGRPFKRRSAADRLADKLNGRGPKRKVSRFYGAERIVNVLREEKFAASMRFDQEHPEDTIFINADREGRPRRTGVVEVRSDGSIGYDRDFALFPEEGIAALVNKVLDGLELDPALNPPPELRTEIPAWEAAYDIATRASDDILGRDIHDGGYTVELAPHRRGDMVQPRQVIFKRRTSDHEEVGRVLVYEDGRVELSEETKAEEREDIESIVSRALRGRRVKNRVAETEDAGGSPA
jgi:hypothetical protein